MAKKTRLPKKKKERIVKSNYTVFQKWLTQYDNDVIADACGVSRQQVWKWRAGIALPHQPTMCLLVEELADGALLYKDFYLPRGHHINRKIAAAAKKRIRWKRAMEKRQRKGKEPILGWEALEEPPSLRDVRKLPPLPLVPKPKVSTVRGKK